MDRPGLVNRALTDRQLRVETERWFLHRGVPHLIDNYSASERIWTRARPFLVAVLLLETTLAFNDRYSGWTQGLVFLASTTLLLVAVAWFNSWRGRRRFDVPDEVGWPELGFFILAPALIALIVSDEALITAAGAVIGNAVLLGLTYVVVGYGLIPMTRWAIGKLGVHLLALARLVARTLPVLLILTVFMFINAEIWQVAYAVEPPTFAIVAAALAAIGLLFLWLSTLQILDELDRITTWEEVHRLAAQSPLADIPQPTGTPPASSVTRGGRINIRVLIVVSLAVQVILVGLLVSAFYIFLGLLFVNDEVLRQWTESDDLHRVWGHSIGNLDLIFTREHGRVAGLVGVLAGLNVAVVALSDENYRQTFAADLTEEVRENLAVKRLYGQLEG